MKKSKKIILIIISVILVAIIALTAWQWENINAVVIYASNSEEQITNLVEEKHAETTEVLQKYEGVTAINLSPEQESALISGEISADEVIEQITNTPTVNEPNTQKNQPAPNNTTPKKDTPKAAPQQNTQKPALPKEPIKEPEKEDITQKTSEIINRHLKEIYTLKAEFLGKLSNVKDAAIADFLSLPEEQRTKKSRSAIIAKRLLECYELENQCDVAIEKILTNLKNELSAIGADTSVISEIRNAYKEEKSVKKAYYISKFSLK